jgi:predicted phosphodiesterase
MSFRVLHTSDLHGRIEWFRWLRRQAPTFDLVSIAGDLFGMKDDRGLRRQMTATGKLLQDFPAPLALCSGNHDMVHDYSAEPGRLWFAALRRVNLWVDGDRFQLGGHDFRCLGWGNPVPPTHPEQIWITHAPPDGCGVGRNRRGHDLGDFELGEACRASQGPSMVLCGHIHAPACWHAYVGRTLILNSGHAENAPYPNHIVLDSDSGIAELRRHGHRHEIVPLKQVALVL